MREAFWILLKSDVLNMAQYRNHTGTLREYWRLSLSAVQLLVDNCVGMSSAAPSVLDREGAAVLVPLVRSLGRVAHPGPSDAVPSEFCRCVLVGISITKPNRELHWKVQEEPRSRNLFKEILQRSCKLLAGIFSHRTPANGSFVSSVPAHTFQKESYVNFLELRRPNSFRS